MSVKKVLVNICRLVMAPTFILSGFVKAVDPLGTQYKLNDYLEAMHVGAAVPDFMTLVGAVALAAVEFLIGIFLLFAIRRRFTSRITLLFMTVMTALTVWIYIADPVSDCGCFGDAVVLTNGETLLKNIVLLACAVVVWKWPRDMWQFISQANQWIVVNYSALFIFITAALALYDLPQFDFRPYHVGANIKQGMEIPEGAEQPQFVTTYIMEKDGQRQEFTVDNYPDSTWTYIDARTVQTSKGYEPPIHDFMLTTPEGDDITDSLITQPGYVFLLVTPHLEQADDSNIDLINQVYDYAEENGYLFWCLTASSEKAINRWRDITGAEYPFAQADDVTLKTVIRSNPGLLLLKDGTVIRKWSHNRLPDEEQLKPDTPLEQLELGQMPEDSVPRKVMTILLWYVLPLLLLTLADRLWAWSKWFKKKEESNKVYQLLKRKKMRKKIVAGNWKMNMNLQDGIALAKELNETLKADKPNCGVVICTPFIHLASIAQFLDQDIIGLGAENCADKEKGAFTGEVSAEMVKSTGAQYV
ncbi:MAG: triose-phosphate isomerase, partial [Prevotella sp.]|nr:triose-phosphate isomerase [Prevotella sp.]